MKKYESVNGKDRLTISLPRDILSALDEAIDGREIRNRSHAIEHYLRLTLKPTVTTAVILAGGRQETGHHPALTEIDGRTLLDITLSHIAGYGFRNVYMLAGPYGRRLSESLGRRSYGMKMNWIEEEKPLGTGGALGMLEGKIREQFLVLHGDILTNIPLDSFISFHLSERTLVTIAVKPRHSEPKYGQVLLQGNRITTFLEHDRGAGTSIINTGVYLMDPAVFAYIPKGKPSGIEVDVFPRLASENELSAFFFQGMWFDIRNRKDMQEVVRRYRLEQRR